MKKTELRMRERALKAPTVLLGDTFRVFSLLRMSENPLIV